MRQNKQEKYSGVSPVVAVMLMLVVTIIIAAVVSAFAGGLSKTQDKVPQMTFDGKYSISKGIQLTHTGGDPLQTAEVLVEVSPGTGFGAGSRTNAVMVNKSHITDATGLKFWQRPGGVGVGNFTGTSTSIWSSGTTAYVLPPYHTCGSGADSLQQYSSSSYYYLCFNNTANVGNGVLVQILNVKGQQIAQSEIPIVP